MDRKNFWRRQSFSSWTWTEPSIWTRRSWTDPWNFLRQVERLGKRYVFFTNNSSKSPRTYIDKLAKMDCHIRRDQIITSGDVMIEYLKMYYPGKRVYLVGTPDLEENFRENGILLTKNMPDVVVIGFDMTLTYEKLERACTYIRSGAVFLATHLDINCPTRAGFIPDCGAMCAAISLSTESSRSMWENHLRKLWIWC